MFTRIVDFIGTRGKTRDLKEAIQTKILPILRGQPGFVDEIVLESDIEPDRVLALSFWRSREDAERYNREQYSKVKESLRGMLESEPVVKTFNVTSSTAHKIAPGKAA